MLGTIDILVYCYVTTMMFQNSIGGNSNQVKMQKCELDNAPQ